MPMPTARDWSQVLVAIHRDGMPAADIARQIGISRQSVHISLSYHAQRYRRQYPDLLDRLRAHSTPDADTGCWRWHGGLSNGYPSLSVARRGESPRRLAWQWKYGELPPRLRVHTTCGEQYCVNPEHMTIRPQGTPRTDVSAFWARVDRSGGDDACWPWLGAITESGQPAWVEADGRSIPPAVRAIELTGSRQVRENLTAVRVCQMLVCVNPRHHHLSSSDGYTPHIQRGEDRPNARLTAMLVEEIRARHLAGASQASLSREYGVHSGSVSMIVNRRIWIPHAEAVLRRLYPGLHVEDGCLVHEYTQDAAHVTVRGAQRSIRHIAWEIATGETLAQNTRVYTTCGTPRCVRPDHLTLLRLSA
ncbi:MAG TPA: hypothetical protein DEU95_10485 [Chloroflexi bacterium]|nr:hypothetical protein [Chloroflexota bacterium]HCG30144.1 hypothetical protein [Chloroflexota bacterium]